MPSRKPRKRALNDTQKGPGMTWFLRIILGLILLAVIVFFAAELRLKPLNDEARTKAPGAFLEVSEGRLHYRFDGPEQGPLVVLVHGFSTPNFIYAQNVTALNESGFRTLRFDHFGRGWSDRPSGKYDVDFYDQALLELLDGLGLEAPIHLAGLSMGGPIVAEFAARHPERVDRLVLLVPAGLDTAGSESPAAALVRAPVIGDWLWRMMGRGILLGDPQYDEAARAPEDRLQGDVTVQMAYRGYLGALLSSVRHMPMTGREDTFTRLAETGIPTLAIYGAKDATVLVSSAAQLEALMPEADIRILEEGEHGLNYQHHGIVNPWLVTWLEADQMPQ